MEGPEGKTHACCNVNGTTLARTAEKGILPGVGGVTTSGAGAYLVTLAPGYAIAAEDANVSVSARSATGAIVGAVQLSDTTVGVTAFTHAGAPANTDFSLRITRENVG